MRFYDTYSCSRKPIDGSFFVSLSLPEDILSQRCMNWWHCKTWQLADVAFKGVLCSVLDIIRLLMTTTPREQIYYKCTLHALFHAESTDTTERHLGIPPLTASIHIHSVSDMFNMFGLGLFGIHTVFTSFVDRLNPKILYSQFNPFSLLSELFFAPWLFKMIAAVVRR